MDPLSISASIIALLQLTKTLAEYGSSAKNASKEQGKLEVGLESTRILLQQIDSWSKQNPQTYTDTLNLLCQPQGPLNQLQDIITRLQSIFTNSRNHKIVGGLTWPLRKKDVESSLAILERLKTLFIFALTNDVAKITDAIHTQNQAITDEVRALKSQLDQIIHQLGGLETATQTLSHDIGDLRDNIHGLHLDSTSQIFRSAVRWVCPESFSDSQNGKFQKKLSERHEGTIDWFLTHETYVSWQSRLSNQKNLFCPGIPGAGKSVLAATVVNELRKSDCAENSMTLFCFCIYNQPDQTAQNFIAFMLQNAVAAKGSCSKRLMNTFQQHEPASSRPDTLELLDILREELDPFDRVSVIVDALDELESSSRDELLTLIQTLETKFKLLLTSRPITEIELSISPKVALEIEASDADIRYFVESGLNKPSLLQRTIGNDHELRELIVATICQRSKGMFLLASLHVDSIAKKPLKKLIRQALKALPQSINATYDDAIRRIDPEHEDLAFQVFGWICFVNPPLDLEGLQLALSVQFDETEVDEDDLLPLEALTSICVGLVHVEPITGAVLLVHETLQTYLEGKVLSRKANIKETLADACLAHMLSKRFASAAEKLPRIGVQVVLKSRLDSFSIHCLDLNSNGINLTADLRNDSAVKQLFIEGPVFANFKKAYCHATDHWKRPGIPILGIEPLNLFGKNFRPLHLAIRLNFRSVIPWLLESETDINRPVFNDLLGGDERFITPLVLAITCAGYEATIMLLEKGANPYAPSFITDSPRRMDMTPIHAALCFGDRATVEAITSRGVNISNELSLKNLPQSRFWQYYYMNEPYYTPKAWDITETSDIGIELAFEADLRSLEKNDPSGMVLAAEGPFMQRLWEAYMTAPLEKKDNGHDQQVELEARVEEENHGVFLQTTIQDDPKQIFRRIDAVFDAISSDPDDFVMIQLARIRWWGIFRRFVCEKSSEGASTGAFLREIANYQQVAAEDLEKVKVFSWMNLLPRISTPPDDSTDDEPA